jgi:60 kDa SS-A/Ro ribonucleoprotein
VNTSLFATRRGRILPPTDAKTAHGTPAYSLSPKEALAAYATTGCFNNTFYASAEDQMEKVFEALKHPSVSFEFIAKLAVYAREKGRMKDLPAFLVAFLAAVPDVDAGAPLVAHRYLNQVFIRVIDNGRMLRNFVQVIRSGQLGRKSLGSRPKKLVQGWFESRTPGAVFWASVGNEPSVADVIRMTHPRPTSAEREALYGYLIGKKINEEQFFALPRNAQDYELFKRGVLVTVPDNVPFELLTNLTLTPTQWKDVARNAGWLWLLKNLNTLQRHGCLSDPEFVKYVAGRLRDPLEIRQARVFPYQILNAYLHADSIDMSLKTALQDGLDHALVNVPELPNDTYVCLDVSPSMLDPITGQRRGSTSKVRRIDAASLFAAALLRRNPDSVKLCLFDSGLIPLSRARLNPRDSVVTLAESLARLASTSSGTNCSAPLQEMNRQNMRGDLCIYLSDNQSWVDGWGVPNPGGMMSTRTAEEWETFRVRNPRAKLVCIDVAPYDNVQTPHRPEILHVGGFSDSVFDVVNAFVKGDAKSWVEEIEKDQL